MELAQTLPVRTVCVALGTSRSTLMRRRGEFHGGAAVSTTAFTRRSTRRYNEAECAVILATLSSDRFADLAVPQIFAQLLDEGRYLCSESTMYRLLRRSTGVRERRDLARHPDYQKPELVASKPREVFSWDITKVRGPERGVWYSLLVMIDIFSRFVVGWCLVRRSTAAIAANFAERVVESQQIVPGQVVIHNDRGTEMTAEAFCNALDALGVERSLSRPRVSNDNPFSESAFKTMKYHRDYPDRFGSFEDAQRFFRGFFPWFNYEHRHSGIAMLTPATVHEGRADDVLADRHAVMIAAHAANPQRFINGRPKLRALPAHVWINKPSDDEAAA